MNKIKIIFFYFLFFSDNILFSSCDVLSAIKFAKINIYKSSTQEYFDKNGHYECAELLDLTIPLWVRNFNSKSNLHIGILAWDTFQLIDWTNEKRKKAAIEKLDLNENFLSKSLIWMMKNTPTHNGLDSIVKSAEYAAYKLDHFGEKFSVNEILVATVYRTILVRNLLKIKTTKNNKLPSNQLIKAINQGKTKIQASIQNTTNLDTSFFFNEKELKLTSEYYNLQNLLNNDTLKEEEEIDLAINLDSKFFSYPNLTYNIIQEEEEEEEEEQEADITIKTSLKLSSRIDFIFNQRFNNNNNNTIIKKKAR